MNKNLNIAEILKDCPRGMELDCAIYENVELDYIEHDPESTHPIHCLMKINGGYNALVFTHYGCNNRHPNAKCVIFPKGKTTWEGFQRPFKDGDVVATLNGNQIFIFKEDAVHVDGRFNGVCYLGYKIQDNRLFKRGRWLFSRHATEEEKQKLFDAIKANGYKWNPETKTLEKLIVPKFKVGDRIKHRLTGDVYKVSFVLSNGCGGGVYDVAVTNEIGKSINIKEQDSYELVPNKFDITTLKPFDKVLVRCNSLENWHIQFFEKYNTELGAKYPFICLCNSKYCQCIPYESNEHLLNTTNDCDEYFKTWK